MMIREHNTHVTHFLCSVMKKTRMFVFAVLVAGASVSCLFVSCGSKTAKRTDGGDTLHYKYARLLTMVRHKHYNEAIVASPWKQGTTLHKYYLVRRADSASVKNVPADGDVVYTPVQRALIATSPLCQLMLWLGAADAIGGVCDAEYMNIPYVAQRIKSGAISDCGSSMSPSVEVVAVSHPQAMFFSSFENSSYAQFERLGMPVVECVEYMEPTALARAEWMKFYGMLVGKEREADMLFDKVDKQYAALKKIAATDKHRPVVVTERVTGGTWFCPGGKSTMSALIGDANAQYVFAADGHGGSLSLAPEAVAAKASDADVWMFVYSAPQLLSKSQLLAEYHGYANIKAFKSGNIYQCSNMRSNYFNEISFRPDYLLSDFIKIFHPSLVNKKGNVTLLNGGLRYYEK